MPTAAAPPTDDQAMLTDPGVVAAAKAAALQQQTDEEACKKRESIKRWREDLRQGMEHDKAARERYLKDRKVAAGHTKWLVDTNLVGAIIEILMAFIYAKNPDICVEIAESVGDTRTKKYADMTRTLEIVISRLLKDAGLKRKAKKWVRATMTIGAGWLKCAMQTRTEVDALVQNELNDLKQQLDNIQAIQAILDENSADYATQSTLRVQLEANMTALQAKLERQIATGLVLDVIPADDIQVSPECGELENYLDAPWLRVRFYKSTEEVLAMTGWTPQKLRTANRYHQRPRPHNANDAGGNVTSPQLQWVRANDANTESPSGFLLVEEIQCKRDGVVYTLVDGVDDEWAREPYAPRQSSRFYDLFLLAFHYIDGERHPQSDVQQLASLQDEYGRTRSNFAEHRKRAVPNTIVNGNEVPENELNKITKSTVGEYVAIDFKGDDIRKAFTPKQYPQFDPALYNTQPITTDMEKVSGAQDAMQSGVAVEKTATEAEIQNNGFGARIGTRKDELEDVLADLALHVAEIAMQTLDEAFVIRIAGENAVWPQLAVDDILYGFDVSIRAGSTGRPNTAQRRQSWQALLPLLEKIITIIGNFQTQPNMAWAAQPYIELLHHTADVVGEKFDIDKLIPTPPPGWAPPLPPGMPGQPGPAPGLPEPVMKPGLAPEPAAAT